MIFLTNPNNPTGTLASQEEIERFMAKVPDHVMVVFDEAYYEFLEDPPDTLRYVREGRNVVVLAHFLENPGARQSAHRLRLRPAGADRGAAKDAPAFQCERDRPGRRAGGPGRCRAPARTREITAAGRELLQQAFAAEGLEYVPSSANFVLVKVGDGKEVFRALLQKGVIIRDMDAYGLPEWIRVSIGTMEQNERFLEELRKVLPARVATA